MNTAVTTKTVEQLKQELQQAEEALREQERAVRERDLEEKRAEEQAKANAAQKELDQKFVAALQPIYDALRAAKIPCSLKGVAIDTGCYDTNIHIEQETRTRGSGFFARDSYTSRFVVLLGTRYRNMACVRYPQKKDGTFNVEKIVEKVQERNNLMAERYAEQTRLATKVVEANELASKLQKELHTDIISGVSEYSGYDHRGRWETKRLAAAAGHVYVKVGTVMLNEAQARVLVKALAEMKKLETKKAS